MSSFRRRMMMQREESGISLEEVTEGVYIYNYENNLAYKPQSWKLSNDKAEGVLFVDSEYKIIISKDYPPYKYDYPTNGSYCRTNYEFPSGEKGIYPEKVHWEAIYKQKENIDNALQKINADPIKTDDVNGSNTSTSSPYGTVYYCINWSTGAFSTISTSNTSWARPFRLL